MKRAWMIWFLCFFLISAASAGRKTVERPCFVFATTQELEVLKIELTDEQTRIDAVMYGSPGDMVMISPKTSLRASGTDYVLREAEHVSIGGFTEPESMPESGHLHVSLFFPPLPEGLHAVDFIDKEDGKCIYGLQLTGIEPYVFLPDFLQSLSGRPQTEVGDVQVNPGKSIVNGYILGYDAGWELNATFKLADWLTYDGTMRPMKIHSDGSFHIESDLLLATCARIQLGASKLDLVLLPGKELTLYVHLPRFGMSGSRVLAHKMEKKPYVWFDGEYVPCQCDYVSYREHLESTSDAWWEDIRRARTAYLSMRGNPKADASLSGIASASVRDYVKRRVAAWAEEERRAKAVNGYVVAQVDTAVAGRELLPALLAPYRGRVVLMDFWATWCGPCLRSMPAVDALKKRLAQADIVYIYVTGVSSPEHQWTSMLPGMKGIHYRLTEAQWNGLCRSQGITGIPGYLIFDDEGRLCKTFIGFPGVDVLAKELLRAGDAK